MKLDSKDTLSETETVIAVPGLRRPLNIIHITDCHLTEAGESDAEAVRIHAQKRTAAFEKQNIYMGRKHFERFIHRSNQEDVHATVWTGDIIDFPSYSNLGTISEQFARLQTPYLYTMGNHDWHHGHDEISDQTREQNYRYFRSWLPEYPGFQVEQLDGVRLVALDNSNYQIEESQWNQLLDLMNSDEPWLLFMHIPICLPELEQAVLDDWGAPIMMSASTWTPEARQQWSGKADTPFTRQFTDRLKASNVGQLLGIFCGHVHISHEETFAENRFQYVTGPGFSGQYRLIRLVQEY